MVRFYREFDTLSKSKSVPDHAKSVGRVIGRISQVFGQSGVAVPWDMLRSNRAELTLDASLMFLLPDIDHPWTARKYLPQQAARPQKRMRSWGQRLRRRCRVEPSGGDAAWEGDGLKRPADPTRIGRGPAQVGKHCTVCEPYASAACVRLDRP